MKRFIFCVLLFSFFSANDVLAQSCTFESVSSTIYVNCLDDSGPGTLREAIENINLTAFFNTIYFDFTDLGTAPPYTINLASPLPNITGPSAGGTLLIDGLGSGFHNLGDIIINGNTGISFGFNIRTPIELTVRGLQFQNFGNSSTGSGILVHPTATCEVYLDQNILTSNTNGISVQAAHTYITECDIFDNTLRGIRLLNMTAPEFALIGGSSAATENSIHDNPIGIEVDNSDINRLFLNEYNRFYCNTDEPIRLADVLGAVPVPNPPVITSASSSSISGTVSPTTITAEIWVYIIDESSCTGTIPCQGATFLGKTTPDGAGNWSLPASAFVTAYSLSDQLTALHLFEVGRSDCSTVSTGFYPSEFAVCFSACPTYTGEFETTNLALCIGETGTIVVNASDGTAPYDFTYTENGTSISISDVNMPFNLSISPTINSTYVLTSMTDTDGCPASISSTALTNVTVNDLPVIDPIVENCAANNNEYIVRFTINGAAPFSVTPTGTLNGNIFTSDPFPIGSTDYSFTLTDANGCSTLVSGTFPTDLCSCTTAVGTLSAPNGNEFCQTDIADLDYDASSQVLDGNDLLQFVLVDMPGDVSAPLLSSLSSPDFSFDDGILDTDVTYFVYALVGNDLDSDGNVDLDDGCLVRSGPISILFQSEVVVSDFSLSPTSICVGETANLSFAISSGSLPITIEYTANGVAGVFNLDAGLSTSVSVNPSVNTTYNITQITDGNNCNVSDLPPAVTLMVNELPQIQNLTLSCVDANNAYLINFDINGVPPFTITGLGGSLVGNTFTSDPIAFGTDYNFTVTDGLGCTSPIETGSGDISNCSCSSDAGTLTGIVTEACLDEQLEVSINAQNLDANDVLVFYFSSNTADVLGSAIASSLVPIFSYDPALMVPGQTYFISAVVGNDLDANGLVDPDDGCLSISNSISVIFHDTPAFMNVTANPSEICVGSSVEFTFDISNGLAPYTLNYTVNGTPQTAIINSNSLSLSPTESSTYVMTALTDANACAAAVPSTPIFITVNEAPILVGSPSSDCTSDNLFYTVTFEVNGGDPTTYQVIPPNGTLNFQGNGAVFISNPIPTGESYSFELSDANNCGSVLVEDVNGFSCDCPFIPAPLIVGADTLTICAGESIPSFEASTSPGLIINWYGDAAATNLILANSTNFSPTAAGIYFAQASNPADGCSSDNLAVVTLVINPLPILDLGNDTLLCTGDSLTLSVDSTYASILWNTDDSTATITISPPMDSIYWVEVTDSLGCMNTDSILITLQALPSATLMAAPDSICLGDSIFLNFQFTGIPPFSYEYTFGGVQQGPFLTDSLSIDTFLIPTASDSLHNLRLSDSICSVLDTSSFPFAISNPPQIIDFELICSGDNTTFQIQFSTNEEVDIRDATGALLGTGTSFTSDPFTDGSTYFFTLISTANSCNTTLQGTGDCNCTTFAGTMELTPIELCIDEMGSAIHQNNDVLDTDDLLQFVLHTGSGNALGTIIYTEEQPILQFIDGQMNTGQTYFLSAIAGNNQGGNVDLSDPCLSVSQGVAITFQSLATASLNLDTNICIGESVAIPILFQGQSLFNFDWLENGTTINSFNVLNDTSIVVSPTQNATYTIANLNDAQCAGQVIGQAQVTLSPTIDTSNFSISCNGNNYTISFDIIGGDPSSYQVIGLNGTLLANSFTSEAIPSGTAYNFSISDNSPCPAISISGTQDCPCTTFAGTMELTPIELCLSESTLADFQGNQVLDNNDLLQFVLHTNAGNILGDIIYTSDQAILQFVGGQMMAGQTYYLSAIAGNNLNGEVDLDDPCLNISQGVPISFIALPSATVGVDTSICLGDTLELSINVEGQGPFQFDWLEDGILIGSFQTSTDTSIVVSPTENTIFSIANVEGALCPGVNIGAATIEVDTGLVIDNLVLNCMDSTYTVSFDIAGGDSLNYSVEGGMGLLSNNGFLSDSIPVGSPYTFLISDGGACQVTDLSGVDDCGCGFLSAGSMATNETLQFCANMAASGIVLEAAEFDDQYSLIYILHDSSVDTLGEVFGIQSIPSFSFQTEMVLGETYYISAVVALLQNGMPLLDQECLSVAVGTPIQFVEAPEDPIAIQGDFDLCAGSTLTLEIDDVNFPPITYGFIFPNGDTVLSDTPTYTIDSVSSSDSGNYFGFVQLGDCPSNNIGPLPVEVVEGCQATVLNDELFLCEETLSLISANPIAANCQGQWTSPTGALIESANSNITLVSNLSIGENIFIWTVEALEDCVSSDTLRIFRSDEPLVNDDFFEIQEGSNRIVLNPFFNDLLNGIIPSDTTVSIIEFPISGQVFFDDNNQVFEYTIDGTSEPMDSISFVYQVCNPACLELCGTARVTISLPRILVGIPEGLTANNDGVNDLLVIRNLEAYPNNEVLIANRWGDVVFEQKNYSNDRPWDGRFNGDYLPQGVYYLYLKIEGEEAITSSIHLITND